VTIVVIGGGGQLARSLHAAAIASRLRVERLGRPALDLANPVGMTAAIAALRPWIVINAAAYTAVDAAETDQATAFAVNAAGPEALALTCEALSIPLLHISTDYVFDGTKPAPYTENDPVMPLGAYGLSKREGEQRVAAACARHLILRTAWVHSPYAGNFVKTMLRLAATRDEISVVDDQTGSPTYAPHLADVILALARHIRDRRDVPWGTYHVAGTGETTWCGLAREVFAVSARLGGATASVRPTTTAEYPLDARRPANSRLDCSRLERTFGLSLPPWQQGVADCVTRLLSPQEPRS